MGKKHAKTEQKPNMDGQSPYVQLVTGVAARLFTKVLTKNQKCAILGSESIKRFEELKN